MSTIPDPLPLSEHQLAKLEQLVSQMGKPWERVLDEALENLAQRAETRTGDDDTGESFYDAAMRLGIPLGSVENLPPDLSANPKYMEGFGLHAE